MTATRRNLRNPFAPHQSLCAKPILRFAFQPVTASTRTPAGISVRTGAREARLLTSAAVKLPMTGSLTKISALIASVVVAATVTPSPTPSATPCTTVLSESFDRVTAPALPAGWVATNAAGSFLLSPWVTSTIHPDTAPNYALVFGEIGIVSDKRLDTPMCLL